MGKSVTLTPPEIQDCVLNAMMRRLEYWRNHGYQETEPPRPKRSVWSFDIESACAERAVCKALGAYPIPWFWSHLHTPGQPGLFVRVVASTDRPLLVRPGDPTAALYCLVAGTNGFYTLVGWLEGERVKADEYLQEGVYRVPPDRLNPWDTLAARLFGPGAPHPLETMLPGLESEENL